MAKSASQIIPLKTQLASSMNIIRFADASDLLTNPTTLNALQIPVNQGNGALYEERIYDASAWMVGQQAPNVTAGVAALAGPPTLSAPTPSATGGQMTCPCTLYWISPQDSSGRPQQTLYYVAQFPNNATTNSVVLTLNTAGMTNVSKWYLGKTVFYPNGTSSVYSFYWTQASMAGQTAFTYTDPYPMQYSSPGQLNTGPINLTGNSGSMGAGVPNLATIVTGTWTMTGATSSTGGSNGTAYGHAIPVSICAYNKIGATTNSAVQYVNLGYTDQIPTGPTITAVPATTSGTLAAGTYYYRVAATNTVGASMPGPEVSTTLAAIGNVTVSWAAVTGATGYNVYRGTAPGNETMIASVSGLSCLDAGAATSTIPFNTSVSGCGPVATGSIAYSWSAVTGAIGYRLFTAFNTTWYSPNAYALPTTAGTSYAATGSETISTAVAQGTNNTGATMTRILKHFTLNGAGRVTKIGMTFAPVSGKRYRAFLRFLPGPSGYAGTWVTATSTATQYVEFPIIAGQQYDGDNVWIGIEGEDTTCLIGLPGTTTPASDVYGLFASEAETLVGIGYVGQVNVGASAFSNSADSYLIPTAGAVSVPLRVTRRLQNMTTQLTASGTLSGLATASNQYMCTTNYTYAAPVKSIVPSWNAVVGTTATMQAEVSPDTGTTWYAMTNGVRFAFPTATTQMMFRFTVNGNTQSATIMPGVDGLDSANNYLNTVGGYASAYFTADTGQPLYYTQGYQSGGYGGIRMSANGGTFGMGTACRDTLSIAQPGTNDADVSAWIDTTYNVGGYGGPLVRSTDSKNGYLLAIDSATPSTLKLYALVNSATNGGLPTAIATVTLGLSAAKRRLRLVAVGSHLMGFVDGQLYIDIVNSTVGVGTNAGVAGTYITCSGFTVNSTSTAAPANQMESFSAFLEY